VSRENIIETSKRLTRNCSSDEEKAVKLFYFVRDSIPYNLYMISVFIEDFRASRILEWRKGYCVQKAVLLTALSRAVGIPTRMAFAKIANHRTPPHLIRKLGNNIFIVRFYGKRWFQINFHLSFRTFFHFPFPVDIKVDKGLLFVSG